MPEILQEVQNSHKRTSRNITQIFSELNENHSTNNSTTEPPPTSQPLVENTSKTENSLSGTTSANVEQTSESIPESVSEIPNKESSLPLPQKEATSNSIIRETRLSRYKERDENFEDGFADIEKNDLTLKPIPNNEWV